MSVKYVWFGGVSGGRPQGGYAALASALAGACCASFGRAQRVRSTVARLIPGSLKRREGLFPARLSRRAMQPLHPVRRWKTRAPPPAYCPRSGHKQGRVSNAQVLSKMVAN